MSCGAAFVLQWRSWVHETDTISQSLRYWLYGFIRKSWLTSGLDCQALETKEGVERANWLAVVSAHCRKLQVGAIRGGDGEEETVILRSPLHVDISRIQNLPSVKSNNNVPAPYLSTSPVSVLEKSGTSLWSRWGNRNKSNHTSPSPLYLWASGRPIILDARKKLRH